MKTILVCSIFLILLFFGVFFLTNNGSNKGTTYNLGVQPVVIKDVSTGKYSCIYGQYDMPLPNGNHLPLSVKSKSEGLYKKINLKVGETIMVNLSLYEYGQEVSLNEIDIKQYIINE